jgi:serine/threonine protein kinase
MAASDNVMNRKATPALPIRAARITSGHAFHGVSKEPYIVDRLLACGAFGKVFECYHADMGQVAVKVIDRNRLSSTMTDCNFAREIEALDTLRHPSVIALRESFMTDSQFFIVTDLAPHGDLLSNLLDHGCLNVKELTGTFSQCVRGLSYIHSGGYVHRDIKLENILVTNVITDRSGDLFYSVSIADFGLARKVEEPTYVSPAGTRPYMAPELLGDMLSTYDSFSADRFSLGVLLYVLCVGSYPAEVHCDMVADLKNALGNAALRESVSALTDPDPLSRPTLGACAAFSWLHGPCIVKLRRW